MAACSPPGDEMAASFFDDLYAKRCIGGDGAGEFNANRIANALNGGDDECGSYRMGRYCLRE